MTLLGIGSVLIAFAIIIYSYFKYAFSYWERKGVPSQTPSIPFGNAGEIIIRKKTLNDIIRESYTYFKSRGYRHGGSYFSIKPRYLPVDLEIIKSVMTTDFNHFVNHGIYSDEKADPLSGHLFLLEDEKWRSLRAKLTPTFSSAKMKMMFQTLVDTTKELNTILNNAAEKNEVIDVKSLLKRFTMDVIGSCAFGIECCCLKNQDNDFYKYGNMSFENDFIQTLKIFTMLILPAKVLSLIKFKFNKSEVINFFVNLTKDVVKYRETEKIFRKDFMQLLIQLRNHGKITDEESYQENIDGTFKMTMGEIAAQAFVFFIAGFETSSTTMTFATLELAINGDIQKKARQEVHDVLNKHEGQLTYEAIMEMKYLDRVVQETLRKYPPLATLNRKCNKDYTIPKTNIVIEKGTVIDIPVLGIHHDPDYYPEPEKFDPERFTDENKSKRPSFSWIPFGEGPRICIGMRFGLLQTKVGLATLLRNYHITLNERTMYPIKIDGRSFILNCEGGVWINFQKVNN